MATLTCSLLALIGSDASGGRWIHPMCRPLPLASNGPFALLPDGGLMAIDSDGLRVSRDDGRTWTEAQPVDPGAKLGHVGHVGQFLRTRSGAIVLLYLDMAHYRWGWDDANGVPHDDVRLELWAIRSLDGGKTWVDRQRLLGGYNADFTGFIQTGSGRLVATVEHLASDPARWVVCSFWSDDDGRRWTRSNWIDLGGHGHHDGATEPAVEELKDGRLLMLIRTNLGRFWQAFSEDGGRYWRRVEPSPLDASSAPGYLLRLRSGRLALAWNRLHPEGRPDYPRAAAPSPASEEPASWHREELALALSDDGHTWSKPVVVAREPGAQLAYPYLFERRPGEVWVLTRYTFDRDGRPAPPVSVSLDEEALVRAAS